MKKRMLGLCVLAVLALGFGGYVMVETFSYMGEKALSRMNPDETAFLSQFEKVNAQMTYEQVVEILGPPDRSGAGMRPTWKFQGNPLSQVALYFHGGHPKKLRWLKLGGFVYEKDL